MNNLKTNIIYNYRQYKTLTVGGVLKVKNLNQMPLLNLANEENKLKILNQYFAL